MIINAPGMGVGEGAGRKDISSFSRCSTGAHKTLELSGEFQIQRAKQMDKIDLGPTEVYFAVKTFNKHMPSVCTLFKRVLRVRVYVGTAEPIFNLGGRGGGLENERRCGEFVGGSGGIPQKILKSRGSERDFQHSS